MYPYDHPQNTCNTGTQNPTIHNELQRDMFQVVSVEWAEKRMATTEGCGLEI